MSQMKLKKVHRFKGEVTVPGDKSISHRALLFGAIAEGNLNISGLGMGHDVLSTKHCLEKMGIQIQTVQDGVEVFGKGLFGLAKPSEPLDCGNSGTTIRHLMGLLSGQKFSCTLFGDASLSKRPMGRLQEPLEQMGARIQLSEKNAPPVEIFGAPLKSLVYSLPVASAQVKSSLLLAGLHASGTSVLKGKIQSRDHTERMLEYFGVKLIKKKNQISIQGGQTLVPKPFSVPGDPSSAAYFLAAASVIQGADVTVNNVLLNPTRIAFFQLLQKMGADLQIKHQNTTHFEPLGSIRAKGSRLKGITIGEDQIPYLIDEIPLLAVVACFAHGKTIVRGAQELRVKESDRLEAIGEALLQMGAKIELLPDGFIIEGPQKLEGASVKSYGDHRIAMSLAVAAIATDGQTCIEESDCVSISYPNYFLELGALCE
jgi:3-phosphoshikimate 1-carboxyvinyltransferase